MSKQIEEITLDFTGAKTLWEMPCAKST